MTEIDKTKDSIIEAKNNRIKLLEWRGDVRTKQVEDIQIKLNKSRKSVQFYKTLAIISGTIAAFSTLLFLIN